MCTRQFEALPFSSIGLAEKLARFLTEPDEYRAQVFTVSGGFN